MARDGRRAVHGGQHADVVACSHAAVRAHDAHERGGFGPGVRGPRVRAGHPRGVTVEAAHRQVVYVHVRAAADRLRSEADDLAVAADRLASRNVTHGHLVTGRNQSAHLNSLADSLGGVISTNGVVLRSALANMEETTASLSASVKAIEGTDGLVGSLLNDPAMKARTEEVLSNLATLSSNLNRYGLLYKPKTALPRPMTNSAFPYPGKFGR